MIQFKLSDKTETSDKIAFYGKKVKVIAGLVKLAYPNSAKEHTPRLGHLFYFVKQNFIALYEPENNLFCKKIIQIAEIKTFEFDERKTMFKITLQNFQAVKFVFKIKETSDLFQVKIKKNLNILRIQVPPPQLKSWTELKYFVACFFENIVHDFLKDRYVPKPGYKNLIEGIWSKNLVEIRLLKYYLQNTALKEIEAFLLKESSPFDQHVLILTAFVELSEEDTIYKNGDDDDSKPTLNKNTLIILSMSKPMFYVNPKNRALANMYNKYLTPGKFSQTFKLNRIYFISRLKENSTEDFDYWILPFS